MATFPFYRCNGIFLEGWYHNRYLVNKMFIIDVQCDNDSVYICAIWAIYTNMFCTDGMITFIYVYMLLAIYSIQPNWLIVHGYLFCTCYEYIWIFLVYRCMFYYMKYLYHYISIPIIFKTVLMFALFLNGRSFHHNLLCMALQWCVFH